MRHSTLREIQRRERVIAAEGFGMASAFREGAVEVRELAEQLRRFRLPPVVKYRKPARRNWR